MNKVLITGSHGFIGSQLVSTIQQQGVSIRTLSRHASSTSDDHIVMDLAKDSCPSNLCQDIDTVFHLAGKAHALSETQQDENQYQQINVEATRKLLAAAQQAGVQRFIFFSSVKAVADNAELCIDETIETTADTPYGKSKRAAEQLVLHGGYVPHPVVIRPSMVYGKTHKGNLSKMIKAIQRGFFPALPEFNNQRSMVHVDDVIQAALLAANNCKASGQIYIVTDQQDYSTRQLYDFILASLGKPPAKWVIPLILLKTLAKFGDNIGQLRGRRFIFDSDALHKLSASARYSSAKISNELGYKPQHNLPDSLPDIIHFLKS